MGAQWVSAEISPGLVKGWMGTAALIGLILLLAAALLLGLNQVQIFSFVSSTFGGLFIALGILWICLLSDVRAGKQDDA